MDRMRGLVESSAALLPSSARITQRGLIKMDRVRGLVDTGGILLPSPIRRINTEHLVFAPDAFFIAIVRMIIHLSASHTTKGVSESTAPLEAISAVMIALISAFLHGFFKNPALKPECGIIEVDAQQDSFIPAASAITAQSVLFGFFKNPASKSECGIIEVDAQQDSFIPAASAITAQSVPFGFFKNPASKPKCGIIEVYRTYINHHPIGQSQWDIFMGYAYATAYTASSYQF